MAYGTTRRENDVTSAAFYVGLGEQAECLGTLKRDGSPADMDDLGLFGPSPDSDYTETTFRSLAATACKDGEELPSGAMPDQVYVFKNGSVLVYQRGFSDQEGPGHFQVALHYPNGARRPVHFAGDQC